VHAACAGADLVRVGQPNYDAAATATPATAQRAAATERAAAVATVAPAAQRAPAATKRATAAATFAPAAQRAAPSCCSAPTERAAAAERRRG
jgi:hypothetical protein